MSVGKSFSSAICRILQDVPLAKRRCQEVLGRQSSPTWRPAHAPFKLWRVPTTRDDLLAWVHAHGLAALDELFGAEAVALAGPKADPPRDRPGAPDPVSCDHASRRRCS